MAARKRRGTRDNGWSEDVRSKIQTSMLVNRLVNHILGKVELSNTQVTAALGLIRKTLPDLNAVDFKGQLTVNDADRISDAELAAVAARGRAALVEAEDNPPVTH